MIAGAKTTGWIRDVVGENGEGIVLFDLWLGRLQFGIDLEKREWIRQCERASLLKITVEMDQGKNNGTCLMLFFLESRKGFEAPDS